MLAGMRRLAFVVPFVLTSACTATPPADWARGGALLDIPRARWVYGLLTVDVMPDGKVFINGEHELNVDRGGRVFDTQAEPLALLEPDGRVVGPDDASLGTVGALHASLPGEKEAWLTVASSGVVVRYVEEGERSDLGVWMGCNVTMRAQQTCTLLTHLIGMRLREFERQGPGGIPGSGVSVGVGVGFGVQLPLP
jgi:hypothetical protein